MPNGTNTIQATSPPEHPAPPGGDELVVKPAHIQVRIGAGGGDVRAVRRSLEQGVEVVRGHGLQVHVLAQNQVEAVIRLHHAAELALLQGLGRLLAGGGQRARPPQ